MAQVRGQNLLFISIDGDDFIQNVFQCYYNRAVYSFYVGGTICVTNTPYWLYV